MVSNDWALTRASQIASLSGRFEKPKHLQSHGGGELGETGWFETETKSRIGKDMALGKAGSPWWRT